MSIGEPGIKRALAWVLSRMADDPSARRAALIDEASREFDLTPLQADFLYRQLRDAAPPGETPDPTPGDSAP